MSEPVGVRGGLGSARVGVVKMKTKVEMEMERRVVRVVGGIGSRGLDVLE